MFNKSIFKNRNFLLLWTGQLVSSIGSSLQMFAMSWYIYEMTGSTMAMGVSVLSHYLPNAVSSPLAGAIADRYDRKKIIIGCDMLSALISFTMFGWASAGRLTLVPIVVFNALQAVVSAFFFPAVSAATQSVLTKQEYQDSNALVQLRVRFPGIIGALLGGFLLKSVGVKYLLALNALSFLLSALSECFITLPERTASKKTESLNDNIRVAFSFLLKNRIVLWLVFFSMMIANGLFMSMSLYLPGIFMNVLGGSSVELGIYYSINAVFATFTALYLISRKQQFDPYKGAVTILFLEAAVLAAHGLMPNLISAYLLAICMGVLTTACSVFIMTIFQILVPNQMMGRIGSFGSMLNNATVPLFTLLFGVLGERFALQPIILSAGVAFFLLLLPAPAIFAREIKAQAVATAEQAG